MPMRPCKCGVKNWSFELADPVTVKATCKACENEVRFTTPKLPRKAKRVYAPFKPHFTREEIDAQTGEFPW